MFLKFSFVVALQCLSASAQVYFSQPVAGEIVSGGVPFMVSVYDSLSVPYFGQMKNFSLLLLTGTYSSPYTIYAWNLSSTNPASVSSSISFPRALAPNATNAFFLGIQGYLILNTSISTTYYSSLFTLQNMTGASSLLPAVPSSTSQQSSTFTFSSTTVVSVVTATPGRSISCLSSLGEESIGETGGNGGIINQGCESAALSAFILLAKEARTLTAVAASLITSPPAFSQFAALLAEATSSPSPTMPLPSMSMSMSISQIVTATPSAGINGLGPATSTASSDSSSETAEMTYMLTIAGITLATVVLLFWIWTRYRRNRYLSSSDRLPSSTSKDPPSRCMHANPECECPRLRKMYDGVVAEFNLLRLGSIRSRSATCNTDLTHAEKGLASQGTRPGASGSSNELPSSGPGEVLSLDVDIEERRRRFEDEYRRRRASRASQRSRRSQRTVLAELEGDLGPYGQECEDVVPPMPAASAIFSLRYSDMNQEEEERYERVMRTRNKTFAVRRKTMVGEGKTGVFIKGKIAATIVAVRSKAIPGGGVTKGRIEEGSELDFPAMMDEQIVVYDGNDEVAGQVAGETGKRNGGELNREVEDEKTPMPEDSGNELGDVEAAVVNAMKQTRLDDLRRERRRRKREDLAKGGGSRDLGIVVPIPSE